LGPFINTLPVRVRVASQGAAAGVRGTHAQLAELLRHEHASLALAQRCSGVAAPAPLFTALLNYRTGGGGRKAPPSPLAGTREVVRGIPGEGWASYPVALLVDDRGQGFDLMAQAPASVGPERVCAMVHRALEGLVEALETAPERAVGRVEVLPEAERRQVVEGWNATAAGYPADACAHELFQAQAARTPEAAALVHDGGTLAYAELNARANRLAHHLTRMGVGPDVRVGLCLERGPEMVVALLAVLKAGGAYVPLDPEYPEARLRYMLADSAPAVLLTQASLRARFAEAGVPLLALDADAEAWAGEPETDPARGGLTPEHLAYVIYTSGSTGQPKGVMVPHRGLTNYVWFARSRYVEDGGPVAFPLYSSLSFDLTVTSVYLPLVTGGSIVIPPNESGDRSILRVFEEDRVDVVKLTPSHLVLLAQHDLKDLRIRRLVVGGEDLKSSLAQAIHAASAGRIEIENEYGPTEATVGCVVRRYDAEADLDPSVPIGAPIANMRAYVLDGAGEPVPAGVVGELFLGGVGIARGYLDRPRLTAERFIPDPFGGEAGARLYRTGDLARWRRDGTMEFLGRGDDQVKVRGFRIEPGEIEARLAEHAGVREAVVVVREDAPGDLSLAAYYVAEGDAVGVEALRAHLAERLPEYMVPSAYVVVKAWPLTPNGKLDRGALPAPGDDARARPDHEALATAMEVAVAEIWAKVLGVERVGRHDDFFKLGGHSLRAVQVVSRVRQALGIKVSLGQLFDRRVLADFARALEEAGR
ncbi:MAG TPA: amino acid adenylation domain-containing protein, partial [Longimicrobium sp.]|nr:amino acid adenylation domain-containing protein [Longimicrobium sp.]